MKKRSYMSWKKEVAGIIEGLPVVQAAEVIVRNASESFNAGELDARGHNAAMNWADKVFSS